MFEMTIPGAPSFKFKEFFVTVYDAPLMREEFLKLPHPVQTNITKNIFYIANRIQTIRDFYNSPILISSGWRSPRVNKAVGGADLSTHLTGMAADIVINKVSPERFQKDFVNWSGGMGFGDFFTHIDIRPSKVRFNYD